MVKRQQAPHGSPPASRAEFDAGCRAKWYLNCTCMQVAHTRDSAVGCVHQQPQVPHHDRICNRPPARPRAGALGVGALR